MIDRPLIDDADGMFLQELHVVLVCDCSGSMKDRGKIDKLNAVMDETVPLLQKADRASKAGTIMVRCIAFDDDARWHVERPTPASEFRWTPLKPGGLTEMGEAFRLVAEGLGFDRMPKYGHRPIVVLMSDGAPTDQKTSFDDGLAALTATSWGKRATRIAIAIGDDADRDTLRRFHNLPAVPVLEAYDQESLRRQIQWAVIETSAAIMDPLSHPGGEAALRPPPSETRRPPDSDRF